MTPAEWGILVFLALIWGGSFFFIEIAITELPVFTVVVGRVFIAALVLLALVYLTGQSLPLDPKIWQLFFVMGLVNNAIPFCLIVWGQIYIASGVASILNATAPLFTVLVAHYFTQDEKLSTNKIMAVLLGLIGVAIMIGGEAIKALGVNIIAQIAVLAAACCYACAGVYGRRFRGMKFSPLSIAAGQTLTASFVLLPMLFIIDQPWTLPVPSFNVTMAVLYLALPATALTYILYFRLLATAGAVNLLLVTFLVPISAIFLGIFFLDEVLKTKHIIGMALIGFGLAILDGRPIKLLKLKFG